MFVNPRPVTRTSWIRRDQWDLFRRVFADKEQLPRSYDEWLALNQDGVLQMTAAGCRVRRVEIDVEGLVAWCRQRDRPVDAQAMMQFAGEVDSRKTGIPDAMADFGALKRTDREIAVGGSKFRLSIYTPEEKN